MLRKVHAGLRREGIEVGRDRVARLMRELGLQGVRRGKFKRITIPDSGAVAASADVLVESRHESPDRA